MIIKQVRLVNFRNHKNYQLNCENMTTLIVGENGSGKTSVLEAIYIALRGRSFRAVDREILMRGEEFYRLEILYENRRKITVVFDGMKRYFLMEEQKKMRLPKEYKYPIVLFEPNDLNLIQSSPSKKRGYFDVILGQLDERYSGALNRYEKALRQRNELLKQGVGESEVFVWNLLLAKYGVEINKKRENLRKEINERLTEVYRTIADNNDEVELRYDFEDLNESGYLKKLDLGFEKDRITGCTNFGVHRNNYSFWFNGVEAEGSASRGEVRSIILALKFIEAELIRVKLEKNPLILLDDVFSELDEKRQSALVSNFKNNQVILTSVDEI